MEFYTLEGVGPPKPPPVKLSKKIWFEAKLHRELAYAVNDICKRYAALPKANRATFLAKLKAVR